MSVSSGAEIAADLRTPAVSRVRASLGEARRNRLRVSDLNIIECCINKSGAHRIRSGHRWIFANEITTKMATLPLGGIVRVLDASNELIGYAHCNPHALLAARILTTTSHFPDREWFHARLNEAAARRRIAFPDNVCRVVHAEADQLPGLLIDRFQRNWVVQILTAGMEKWKSWLIEWIENQGYDSIIFRNDSSFRALEQLPETPDIIGSPPERFEWKEHGVSMLANLVSGQKTGAFLDQSANRLLIDEYYSGGNVLDLFAHTGGFGIRAALHSTSRIHLVDASSSALELATAAAEINGVSSRCEYIKADVFEWLQHHDTKYRMVICDPPALIKSRSAIQAGIRGYESLNRRAMKLVEPGGYFLTFSCSHLLDRPTFLEMLKTAARGTLWTIEREVTQSSDHPILLTHPETGYLKGALLRRPTLS